jgi:hypothetical protein
VESNTWNLFVRIALSTLLAIGFVHCRGASAEASIVLPVINLLVFDYSEVSPNVLAEAERETSRIFAQTGIQFAWVYCSPRPSPDSPSICKGEPGTGEIRVRVLRRHLNYNFEDSVFGFAIAPTFASVYYESAQHLVQTATDSESNIPTILGCLIAHEIGHLLLGHNQHTVSGIMQASWGITQIQQAMKGALGFSPQQAEHMRQSARMLMKRQ